MPTGKLQQGDIVWTRLVDPNGIEPPYERPAVVLTESSQIERTGQVELVAVSTVIRNPMPKTWVPMPYDPHGRTSTGFRRKCVAKCEWRRRKSASECRSEGKYVSVAVIERIFDVINAIIDESQETGD